MGDHPRMCGEHWTAPGTRQPSLGSSPHVRGAQRQFRYHKLPSGIIPACAGSTHCPPTHLVSARDHPRMCGEHQTQLSQDLVGSGSSPHVRGAPCAGVVQDAAGGIIPACAGSTPSMVLVDVAAWDHPRMCGEHTTPTLRRLFPVGSSPHVRGARVIVAIQIKSVGIIPACAGSTRYPRNQ